MKLSLKSQDWLIYSCIYASTLYFLYFAMDTIWYSRGLMEQVGQFTARFRLVMILVFGYFTYRVIDLYSDIHHRHKQMVK